METDIAFAHVKMALNQRQNGAFTGARRAADAQHLTRTQRETDVFKHRMFRLRVDKDADISLQNTRTFRYRLAAIVHYRHFRQHGADTAVGGAPTFNDVKHPGQCQHRPNHQPEVHRKAG